jgi:hypothetical protein
MTIGAEPAATQFSPWTREAIQALALLCLVGDDFPAKMTDDHQRSQIHDLTQKYKLCSVTVMEVARPELGYKETGS